MLNQEEIDKIIINETRKNKDIIYGAQSIKKQIGVLSRPTIDFDIFTSNPELQAKKTEMLLEKTTKPKNDFYVKPAEHKGTYKIKNVGDDKKQNTKDDISIADYTKTPNPIPPFKIIDKVRYRTLTQEAKAKRKALKDKEYAFRHEKDRDDLERVEASKVIFDLFS
jgi:hypothetical protein